MGGLNGEGAVKQMLRIKEIVRGFFCHSGRKLRDIRRGLRAANAWHSSIMHSACPSATPFPVTSAACLITRLDAGFLPQRQHTHTHTGSIAHTHTSGHTGGGRHKHAEEHQARWGKHYTKHQERLHVYTLKLMDYYWSICIKKLFIHLMKPLVTTLLRV